MWIDWTVDDKTAVNTAATLTMDFTFNLYNAAISTSATGEFTVPDTAFTFAPYLTFLNADSATIVDLPFDSIVMPIALLTDASANGISAIYNDATYPYTTPDWTATDFNAIANVDD
jgi:hypothetical protein